jgi:hypothetical protein
VFFTFMGSLYVAAEAAFPLLLVVAGAVFLISLLRGRLAAPPSDGV